MHRHLPPTETSEIATRRLSDVDSILMARGVNVPPTKKLAAVERVCKQIGLRVVRTCEVNELHATIFSTGHFNWMKGLSPEFCQLTIDELEEGVMADTNGFLNVDISGIAQLGRGNTALCLELDNQRLVAQMTKARKWFGQFLTKSDFDKMRIGTRPHMKILTTEKGVPLNPKRRSLVRNVAPSSIQLKPAEMMVEFRNNQSSDFS